MKRAAYSASIGDFLDTADDDTLGKLVRASSFDVVLFQRDAWSAQIKYMKSVLQPYRERGSIYFEWIIPRLGRRIDVLMIIDSVVFVLEFKVGEQDFSEHASDQVVDYALDLKNFHESSHDLWIAPILVATEADQPFTAISLRADDDRLFDSVHTGLVSLSAVIEAVLAFAEAPKIEIQAWEKGKYHPTPTIVEAASALYRGHAVEDISRSDAGALNLTKTTEVVSQIIDRSRQKLEKAICFVTGVPGAGKTLVGLNIATQHIDRNNDLYSVYLSGNGPLVTILREALARDKVERVKERGEQIRKGKALSEVKAFIQNVHHFRDECLLETDSPPIEHVALFDEAQRAWNRKQISKFMRQKKGQPSFEQSEPEFLISCMDRHEDWAVIVCLVGGGQEINTGEAGVTEWIDAVLQQFPHWQMYLSTRLTDSEYGAGRLIERVKNTSNTHFYDNLHLSVSMRSYRAEHVSKLVKQLLDLDRHGAAETLNRLRDQYPIVITRDLGTAKIWLRDKARGSERYGVVVSSQAQRLKPYAIDVRYPVNPVHWFLGGKDDVRSSYYLEDVATEFHIQGLELDWACVTWDADFRYINGAWEHWSFVGSRWNRIRKAERKEYLKNAYRVLLTRARQGMVLVIPEGDPDDPTRSADYYDNTYKYLCEIGFDRI